MQMLESREDEQASLRTDEWEQRLYDANSLDQIKSITESWRADGSAHNPDPDGTYFAVPMMSAIRVGYIPLIKYLLEQGVPIDSTIGTWAVGHSPEENGMEILEVLYYHGWDVNQRSSRNTPILG